MLSRIGAVVVLALVAVWLARTPDWEPLVALVVAVLGYLSIEIAEHRKEKKKRIDDENQMRDLLKRIDALEASDRATRETVAYLKKKDDAVQREWADKMNATIESLRKRPDPNQPLQTSP